jgi:hypothetical protein
VSRRWRATRYGASLVVALVGGALGATIPGTLGGVLATVLIGIGLIGVMSLIFYEVGVSEDRDRARRSAPVARAEEPAQPGPVDDASGRSRRRLERRRGERRRLR